MGLIYRYTSPSGKSYIGQTTGTAENRWREHIRDSLSKEDKCRLLNNAIRKYGIDNFKIEVLIECCNDQLDYYEKVMVKTYQTFVDWGPWGYNLTEGGDSNKNFSEQSKESMRIAQLNLSKQKPKYQAYPDENPPKYIVRWSKEELKNGQTYIYKGFAISEHPLCKFKCFTDSDKSLLELLEEAKLYINGLENGSIKIPPKEILPKGIYSLKDGDKIGYKVAYQVNDKLLFKRFVSKKLSMEEKLKQAIEFNNK